MSDPSNLGAGAGYAASGRSTARLGGRTGTFVLQHWGVGGRDRPQRTAGHVVPRSGTGELVGLSEEVDISVDSAGGHTLTLDYDLE